MEIDMTRKGGAVGLAVAECIDKRFNTWRVRTDFQPAYDEDGETQMGVTFIETEFHYKPSLQEVKDFVNGVIDAHTDAKILNGYEFTPDGEDNPIVVWLSKENQTNFSEAHRLEIVPVKFKLNETADKRAIYHTFMTFAELDRFYKGGVQYINQCLNEGWQEKDNFNFTPYEEALNPMAEEEPANESSEESES